MRDLDRVVILNDFSSTEGGAAYLANALAQGLSDCGIHVTYISGDAGAEGGAPGVDRVPLDSSRLLQGNALSAAMRGLYNKETTQAVHQWIAQHDTPHTIYHLHNWSNILSPAIFEVLAPLAQRTVIHAHDFFLACPNGTYLDFPRAKTCHRTPLSPGCLISNCDKRSYAHKLWRVTRQRLLLARLKPHLSKATFVMIHAAMRPWLTRAIAPKHMVTIRNPVTPFIQPVSAPEAQQRIAYIGQIQRLKGVYDVAEAGRKLGICIEYFGVGENLEDLQSKYPEHAYHGWTERSVIGQHLQTCRAVIVATQSPEPFCLAAFESASSGMPILVSDAILAAPELAKSGAALLFPAGDVSALTSALNRILKDNVLVSRLAKSALKLNTAVPQDLNSWISEHTALYARLVRDDAPAQMEDKDFALI